MTFHLHDITPLIDSPTSIYLKFSIIGSFGVSQSVTKIIISEKLSSNKKMAMISLPYSVADKNIIYMYKCLEVIGPVWNENYAISSVRIIRHEPGMKLPLDRRTMVSSISVQYMGTFIRKLIPFFGLRTMSYSQNSPLLTHLTENNIAADFYSRICSLKVYR